MPPLFSLIIATRNAELTLPRCLESLASQEFRDFEVILQDGASSDATVALAEAFLSKLPNLIINSEPDRGIYDAWNKALPRVRGEWVLFLGSDDTLYAPDVLEQCATAIAGLPDSVFYACGDAIMVYSDGTLGIIAEGCVQGAHDRLSKQIPFCHSSLWHRASLFNERRFDTSLSIAADYDFICHTWPHDGVGHSLGFIVTCMGVGGISSHPRSRFRTLWECSRIAARHGWHPWTRHRLTALAKATLLWGACTILGPKKGAKLLDQVRIMRGLPPCWATSARTQEEGK